MFVELEGVIIDVIEVLGAAGRVSGSLVTVVGDIKCFVPLGTAWWSIWAISTIWAHGELAVGEIDDIGILGTAESGCELFVAVVMELGRFWVVYVVFMLAQAFGAAGSVLGVALTLVTSLWVF